MNLRTQKFFMLFVCFLVLSSTANAQRTRPSTTVPSVLLTTTVEHAECFGELGCINYSITTSNGWPRGTSLNNLNIYDQSGDLVHQHEVSSLSGSVCDLTHGVYRISGSITVKNSSGFYVSVPFSKTVWLGIETQWDELSEMVATPNSYSARRNLIANSYGGAYSNNYLTSGEFWIQMSAVYGTTTNSHVYFPIGETDDLSTFNPNGNVQYIEFYRTSSGSGVRVREVQAGNNYVVHNISTNPFETVRLVRNQFDILMLQIGDSPSNVFTFDVSYSGPMNIGVFAREVNDGCLNVISSIPCSLSPARLSYAKLQNTVDGTFARSARSKLKIYFNERYGQLNSDNLEIKVYDYERNEYTVSHNNILAYDDNRYELDLSGLNLTDGQFYTLEVVISKDKRQYLNFNYQAD